MPVAVVVFVDSECRLIKAQGPQRLGGGPRAVNWNIERGTVKQSLGIPSKQTDSELLY